MDDLFKLMQVSNKMKKDFIDCIEQENFDGFCKYFRYYLTKTGRQGDDEVAKNKEHKIAAIKMFCDLTESRKDIEDRLIQYFEKGNFMISSNMLMAYWTNSENHRFFNYNSEHYKQNQKYLEFFDKGVSVTPEHYKAYCDVLSKESFIEKMPEFLKQQSTHVLNAKLSEDLQSKPEKNSKMKI